MRRVVLCSGKVAHEALHRRDERLAGQPPSPAGTGLRPVDPGALAVVGSSSSTPGPPSAIGEVLARYPGADEVVWLQEEPENMGAWTFVHGRLHRLLRDRYTLRHVSRAESASPATGSGALHQLEQADLLERAIG